MITLHNFQSRFDTAYLDRVMEAACRAAVTTPRSLYTFMQRFISYGRVYSFSVPQLAGIIGSSPLFKDPGCPIASHAERGMDVAAHVFSASIEEFRDPRTGVSHRTLSYALLDKLAEYAELSLAEVEAIAQSDDWLIDLLAQVRAGYAANPNHLQSLVEAIGFHVGAETIGANECSIINQVFFSEQRHSSFGQFIKRSKLQFQQGVVSPWYWIVIHGTFDTRGVEADHSDDALMALNRVVQYTGASEADIVEWAGQGIARFIQVQTDFFQQVQQELQETTTALVTR